MWYRSWGQVTTWHDLRTPAVTSLVLANLIPLAGTLFFGWSSGVIMVLYWFETAVIGFYSILKLPLAQGWYAQGHTPRPLVRHQTSLVR